MKTLQSIGVAFMKTIKSDISGACKVQADYLKDTESDSESNSYDKNEIKDKMNDLVWLHKAKQEKLKTVSYSEQFQILTLAPEI